MFSKIRGIGLGAVSFEKQISQFISLKNHLHLCKTKKDETSH